MSRRSRQSVLSREELEVHEAVSGTDSESDDSPPIDPGQALSQGESSTIAALQRQVSSMSRELAALKGSGVPVSSSVCLSIKI